MKKLFLLVFVGSITNLIFAQGGDNTVSATASPITLPFSANGTTVGKIDDYNNPAGYVSAYTTGPDWLYYFCASSTGSVTTNISYTTNSIGVHPSISIWEGVPGAGGIFVDAITSPGDLTVDGVLALSYSVISGHCYYIMIDNWPTPDGFSYSITTYITPIQASCTNIGFENKNFTGWVGTTGIVKDGISTDLYPVYTPTGFTTATSQHKITSSGNDAIVGAALTRVCPGQGPNSMMLGDSSVINSKGASIEQRFSVTSANALFTYYYAAVLEYKIASPIHNKYEQPIFRVDVLDCNGTQLSCGDYLVVASPSAPGFIKVPSTSTSTSVYYKPWTPVFVDLTPYIGSCITVRFTTGDCSQGGHFGYAYIDASCNPMAINGPTGICAGTNTTLTSPSGGAQYSWIVQGSPSTILGTSQTLTVSPSVNTTYQCTITSVTNCQTVITQTVNVNPLPVISGTLTSCIGGTSTLSATNSPSLSTPWSSSNTGVATVNSSGIVNGVASGSTTITYTDINGCTTTALFTVNPNPIVSGTQTICVGSTSQLIGSASAATTNPWVSSITSVATISNTGLVSGVSGGTTTITYTNTNGCSQTYLFTVLNTPIITNPGPITRCDSYTLPGITGSFLTSNAHYYTASHASSGTLIANGTPITSSRTVWIYDNNSICSDEESFVVTINNTPVIPTPSPITSCDSYILPALTVGNYFTGTGGTGTALTAGASITTSQTVYIYAQTGTTPNCTSEKSFAITINNTPVIPTPINVTACDSYTLPALTVGNYFTGTGGSGIALAVGATITSTQTVYIYAQTVTTPNCKSEESFVVTINKTPAITNPGNIIECDSYALPVILGSNLSGNQNYYTGSQSNNGQLLNGPVTSSQTIWIYDHNGSCSDEESFQVTINISPVVTFSSNINSGCLPLTVTFTNTSSPIGQSLSWNFGDGTIVNLNQNLQSVTHTFQTDNCFDIILTATNNGCSSSKQQLDMICAYAYAQADFSSNKVSSSIIDPTFYFTNTSTNASIFNWSVSDGYNGVTVDLNHTFPTSIDSYSITLIANNIHNCPDTITKTIEITDELIFYVPNAFTPDEDNANPYFTPVFSGGFIPEDFVMYIFNRWGELIFETHDATKGWSGRYGVDGKICQDDVYVWKIEFKEKTTYRSYTKTGHVSLLR